MSDQAEKEQKLMKVQIPEDIEITECSEHGDHVQVLCKLCSLPF